MTAARAFDDNRDLTPVECENYEVCDWAGTADDLDSLDTCPRCFESTVRAPVPGALGFELAEPLTAAGIKWTPADGDPMACPIGTALAAETARRNP
jgi:hypothetical protein